MKNSFILIITLLFLLSAQAQQPQQNRYDSQNGRSIKYVLDSSWFYLGNTFGQAWFNNQRYRVTARDDYGNLVSALTMAYDTIQQQWYNQKQQEVTYYDSATRRFFMSQVWDEKAGEWVMADSIHYNTSGAPLISWYKEWSRAIHRFRRGKRVEYQYNVLGKITQQDIQIFDTLTGNWAADQVQIYTYNALDQLSELLTKTWDTLGYWRDSLHTDYTYNADGDLMLEIRKLRTGNVFANDLRTRYNYLQPGVLREKFVATWNNTNQSWKDISHFIYQYDQNDRVSQVLEKYWDDYEQGWIDKTRTTYTYTAQGQRDEVLQEFYDPINQYWFNTSRYNYGYDGHGNRTSYVYRFWDEQASTWLDIYKEESGYSLFKPDAIAETAGSGWRILPNPVSDILHILNPGRISAGGTLLDLNGKIIRRFHVSAGENALDVSKVKSGTYFLLIDDQGKLFSRKVVVE